MSKKQLYSFIGMLNYCHDTWQGCGKVLAPITVLISKMTPWKWISVEQRAFKQAKKMVSQETLLAYSDFNILFKVHTDSSYSRCYMGL
eukprot:9604274-Ditylum_brightwellii.AAC.1